MFYPLLVSAGADCSVDPSLPGCFPFGVRLGLSFISQMACVSGLAVTILLGVIIYNHIQNVRMHPRRGMWPPHIVLYLIALLVADLDQALGAIMDIKWVALAGIREGAFCTIQGVLKQGDVCVALVSLAIGLQTWSTIAMRWRTPKSPLRAILVIIGIWAFAGLLNGIGIAKHHGADPLYGSAKLWCSIRFTTDIIVLAYLWLWVSAGICVALYVHIAIALRREQRANETLPHASTRDWDGPDRQAATAENMKLALQMLFYPLIYIITITPQSVVRLITFANTSKYAPPNKPFPIAASVFAAVVFNSSGLLNVFLYTYTRPSLVNRDEDAESMEDASPLPGMEKGAGDLLMEAGHGDEEERKRSDEVPVLQHNGIANQSSGHERQAPRPALTVGEEAANLGGLPD